MVIKHFINLKKLQGALAKKRNLKLAPNGSRLCAVWEIEKQNLNYAEKFI